MKWLFNQRIFWSCKTIDDGSGFYYHVWSNIILNITVPVFAGFNKYRLNKKSTTFKVAKSFN